MSWIGVGFIFQGTATTVAAISDRALPGRGPQIFFGVLTIIAGVVVLAWPFDSIVVLAITAGAWLIVVGVIEIVGAFGIRKDANKIDDFGEEIRECTGRRTRDTATN